MASDSNTTRYKGSEFMRLAAGGTRDILTVLLKEDQTYTEAEVSVMVDQFLKKEVRK